MKKLTDEETFYFQLGLYVGKIKQELDMDTTSDQLVLSVHVPTLTEILERQGAHVSTVSNGGEWTRVMSRIMVV